MPCGNRSRDCSGWRAVDGAAIDTGEMSDAQRYGRNRPGPSLSRSKDHRSQQERRRHDPAFRGISANRELRRSYDALVIARERDWSAPTFWHETDFASCWLNSTCRRRILQHLRRRGFIFDAASHFYPLLGNPATLTGKLLRIWESRGWVKMIPSISFTFLMVRRLRSRRHRHLFQLHAEFRGIARLDEFFRIRVPIAFVGHAGILRGHGQQPADRFRQLSLKDVLVAYFARRNSLLLAADCSHWAPLQEFRSYSI